MEQARSKSSNDPQSTGPISEFAPAWSRKLLEVGCAYGFFLQTEDGSDPRNAVRDAGPDQPPVLDYDVQRLQPALREHRAFSDALQRGLLRAGWISFTRRMGVNGTAHACGTLPCGSDPEHSVVDADGQVHGLRGLAVVDGSILPRSSRVNPALTIYAWGLRVGARIALGWTQAMTSERNAFGVLQQREVRARPQRFKQRVLRLVFEATCGCEAVEMRGLKPVARDGGGQRHRQRC